MGKDLEKAEEALHESEERLRLALAGAEEGIWDWNLRTGTLTWDERCKEIFGLAAEAPVTYEWHLDNVHPNDRKRVADAAVNALNSRTEFNEEYRTVWPDGTIRWVLARGRGYYDDHGEPFRMSGTVVDVTDRKKAEEAQSRLAALVESSDDAILSKDLEGNILSWNKSAERLFGYRAEEIIGRHITLLVPPDRFSEEEEILLRLRAGERIKRMDTVRLAKDGRPIDVSITVSPIMDRYDRIVAASKIMRDITEQKQSEKALRESEATLRGILDATKESVWLFRDDGVVIMGNETAIRRMKRPVEEIVGKNFRDLLPAHLAESRQARLRQVIGSGQSQQFEDERDGIQFHHSFYPVVDSEGRVTRVASFSRDVTESKRAEKALRESENRYRELVQNANSAIIRWKRDGTITFFNEYAQTFFGYSADEAIGKKVTILVPERESTGADLSMLIRDIVDHPEPYIENINENVCRDGRRVWMVWTNKPIFDEKGEVVEIFAVGSDITDRKQAEEALRASEARFKLLSATADRLLSTDDPQSIVDDLCRQVMEHLDCQVFLNYLMDERAGRLRLNASAGIPEEEIHKLQWLDYGSGVCGSAADERRLIVAEEIQSNADPRTDLVTSYGLRAYACHPLMVQERLIGTLAFGTKTRALFSHEDLALMKTVTDQVATAMERKRLMNELQSSRDELEIRVRERTAELKKTNEELKIYTTKLEQSNRDLQDFVHVASHDLQEPLRKIQTFGDRLTRRSRERLDDKALGDLERMQLAAGRMQELVQDLLKYSRLASRPAPFTFFNLKESVEEAITDLCVLLEESGGRIEVDDLPDVEADRVQMRQLFQNLIGNGLKYRGEQKPAIRIYGNSQPSDPFWQIYVEDNGIGFDEIYLDKIFKPFQRLYGKESPYTGTGMGLAICRRIAERHGGGVTARSQPGKGSTFILKLPKKRLNRERTH